MEKNLIYQNLADILLEVTHIAKGKTNQQQGFKYRGIDDVMNELHALFAKNGVVILPCVKAIQQDERENKNGTRLFFTKLTVDYTFLAPDGSSVTATAIGEAMDSGDKSTNKAMSVALKYVLLQMFLIPTEDMTDPDDQTYEVKAVINANLLKAAVNEAKECKDEPDLKRVWTKYKNLQTNSEFSQCVSLQKQRIQLDHASTQHAQATA